MKNLIIIGHPNTESFCYDGIFKTIKSELSKNNEEIEIIDLYRDSFTRPRVKLIKKYQDLVTWCERIYFISPVWWWGKERCLCGDIPAINVLKICNMSPWETNKMTSP